MNSITFEEVFYVNLEIFVSVSLELRFALSCGEMASCSFLFDISFGVLFVFSTFDPRPLAVKCQADQTISSNETFSMQSKGNDSVRVVRIKN